jgi:Gluconate 2-dehydrogenase subunit 3
MKKSADAAKKAARDHTLTQRVQPGYYPRYSTLVQQDAWDEATRTLVTGRVRAKELVRFFSADEVKILQAVIDRLLPQDDRIPGRRIPILPAIDERLYKGKLNGFRYENMPPDQEAYRLGVKAINEMARKRFHAPFNELGVLNQELILQSLSEARPNPENAVWKRMPVNRFWAMLQEDCVSAYYSHPWAWDEIGYGGPAYPRGYMRLENGQPEPWEVDEQRYEWSAPEECISDLKLTDLAKENVPLHERGSAR